MSDSPLPTETQVVSPGRDPVWEQRFWLVLVFFWLARLAMALVLDLTPDEAYYWELARRPDWSYFDHPPLVAWMIGLARLPFGDTPLAVRLPALLSLPLICRALYLVGRDGLGNARTGFFAALIPHLTPAGFTLGLVTTPDVPLALFWSLGTLAFLRILGNDATSNWVFLGACLAFGALGKYNMIFFVPAVAVAILWFPDWRSRVLTGRFWMMVGLAALGTLPILFWNSQNEWASFRFQFAHGFRPSSRGILANIGEFLGGQLGTIGPVLFPLFWWIGAKAVLDGVRCREPARLFLGMLALPMMLFFVKRGLTSKVEANWPQIAYLSLMPLTAEWLLSVEGKLRSRVGWVLAPSALLTLLAVVQAMTLVLPLPPRADVSTRMHGWQQMGEAVRRLDERFGRTALFVGQGGPLTALVAFYGRIPPERVAEIHGQGNWQFWWKGRQPASGTSVVYVSTNEPGSEARLFGAACETTLASETLPIRSRGRLVRTLVFTPMTGYRGGVRFAYPRGHEKY